MAVCYQKLGQLEECSVALENALDYIEGYSSLLEQSVAQRMKKLQLEAKIRMQLCALFSQLHQHVDALEQAQKSVKLTHLLIQDMLALCEFYVDKQKVAKASILEDDIGNDAIDGSRLDRSDISKGLLDGISEMDAISESGEGIPIDTQQVTVAATLNSIEDPISLVEKTAQRVKPILEEVMKRMVPESGPNLEYWLKKGKALEVNKKIEADMRIVLGYLNQSELIQNLNIGNIMQIQTLSLDSLLFTAKNECQLNRSSFLEKISLLAVSYFCISTEIRFIIQLHQDESYDPEIKSKESEFWHAKSLELACSFLPSDCPLLSHILLSYNKHHAPSQQTIPETEETEEDLKIVKPMNGIVQTKYNPIIRKLDDVTVTIQPSDFVPAHKITKKMITSYQNFLSYGSYSTRANEKSRGENSKSVD